MINLTLHAIERAKERLGWDEETLRSIAKLAWCNGVDLKKLDPVFASHIVPESNLKQQGREFILYGETVFIFKPSEKLLFTVFAVPDRNSNTAKILKNSWVRKEIGASGFVRNVG